MINYGQPMELDPLRDPRGDLGNQLITQGLSGGPVQHPTQGIARMAQALLGAKLFSEAQATRQALMQQELQKQQAQRKALSDLINPETKFNEVSATIPAKPVDLSPQANAGVDLRPQGHGRGFGLENASLADALLARKGASGFAPIEQLRPMDYPGATGASLGVRSSHFGQAAKDAVQQDPGGAFQALTNFQAMLPEQQITKQVEAPKTPLEQRMAQAIQAGVDPMAMFELMNAKRSFENPKRDILKGADGFNYYADTGERVLPNVQGKPSGKLVKTMGPDGKPIYTWETEAAGQQAYEKPDKPRPGTDVPLPQEVFQQKVDISKAGAMQMSPLDQARLKTEEMKQQGLEMERTGQQIKASQALNLFARKADTVIHNIDKAMELIEKGGPFGMGTTGVSNWASILPGSDARDLNNYLDTVKANIGFDELNQMRENSPTGGALGSVSENENRLLQAVKGALDPLGSDEVLVQNLKIIRDLYPKVLEEKRSAFGETFKKEQGQKKKQKMFYNPQTGKVEPDRRGR